MKAVLIVLCGVCVFQGNLALDDSSQIQAREITQSEKVTIKAKKVVAQQKSTASLIKKRKAEAGKKRKAKRLKEKLKRKQKAAAEKKRLKEKLKRKQKAAAEKKRRAEAEKKRKAEDNQKRKKSGTKVLADSNKTIKSPHKLEDDLGKVCDKRSRCGQGSMPCCPNLEGITNPTRSLSEIDI